MAKKRSGPKLAKKLSECSRQYRWQVEKLKSGLCMHCGRPLEKYRFRCDICQKMHSDRAKRKRSEKILEREAIKKATKSGQ